MLLYVWYVPGAGQCCCMCGTYLEQVNVAVCVARTWNRSMLLYVWHVPGAGQCCHMCGPPSGQGVSGTASSSSRGPSCTAPRVDITGSQVMGDTNNLGPNS